ncbi:MAG: c-type cytochrome biogenesis protein CcmI [Pseudomonadota bacterium]
MLLFVALAAALALGAGFFAVRPLLFPQREAVSRDAKEVQMFRDQLAELDRDLDRGVVTAAEADGAKAEIARRLIAANRRAETAKTLPVAPRATTGIVAGISLAGVPALAALIYVGLGVPGAPDQPFAVRTVAAEREAEELLSQAEAEATFPAEQIVPFGPEAEEFAGLVERLQSALTDRPNDAQGHRLLANALMRLGRPQEAQPVFQRLLSLVPAEEKAEVQAGLAEAMILSAGGYVSREARAALRAALQADASNPIARYYAGVALAQGDRVAEALAVWERLRAESPQDAPWNSALDALIADARNGLAGGAVPGDTDPLAALAQDLQAEGGTPEEWARLVSSLMRLGNREAASAAFAKGMASLDAEGGARLAEAVAALGVDAPLPGPTAGDIAAAEGMAPEERLAMITGMVERMDTRLSAEGGTPEEWVRLVMAYARLDRLEDARAAFARSQTALSGSEAGFVREQALVMGIIVE